MPILFLLCLPTLSCTRKTASTRTAPAQAVIKLVDITKSSGITAERTNGAFGKRWMPETLSGGAAFLDYDNDGWQDILLIKGAYMPGKTPSDGQPTIALYHNNRNGSFTDVTQELGLGIRMYGMGVSIGDFDNDGYDDIFLSAIGKAKLFHNMPDGKGGRKFVEITDKSGISDTGFSTSSAWVDYDRDGKLDLIVCHYVKWSPETDVFCGTTIKEYCRPTVYPGESCRLYHNDGSGHFTDVTKKAGLFNPNSKGLGVCVCDIDGDGWPDIVIANDMESNCLYRNNKNGTFTEIGLQSGISLSDTGKPRAGMGIDAADYRNNGGFGIVIGNFAFEGLALYDAGVQPPYTERSKQAGIYDPSYPFVTFGVLFSDFDNDGLADLMATNGHIQDMNIGTNPEQNSAQHNLLFQNRNEGGFTDISASIGPAMMESMVGRGLCSGDFDNDGKRDVLLIPNVKAPRLLHNETDNKNHWMGIRLIGLKSNRNGYGAKVTVEAGGVKHSAYAHSGGSYLCASDQRLHFGLGNSIHLDHIQIEWPSGIKQEFGALDADRYITLTEGEPEIR